MSDDTRGSDSAPEAGSRSDDDDRSRGSREVVVPMRLYKTVTVFSTLIAVVGVVGGFVMLDAATLQVSTLRGIVVSLFAAVGVSVADGLLTGAFAILGLATIAAGAGVYVLGTRFRAEGMGGGSGGAEGNGNAQDDDAERSYNG